MNLNRVVTHNDFDGVVCAALCSHVYGMENIFFTGPRDIVNRRSPIHDYDIVTDLPYPLECGMWFDHHPGNLEDVKLRGIDPSTIPGRFSPDPSCARTVYNYFSEEWEIASYLLDTVKEADIIDSFDFASIEDWRAPTPGKNVDMSIKAPFESGRHKLSYLKRLTLWIRDYPLDEIQYFSEVEKLLLLFQKEEEKSLEIIRKSTMFIPEDKERQIPIVDLTGYRIRPHVVRHMAYIEYPEALAAVVIANPVSGNKKTTNLSLTMSLSVLMNNRNHGKDVGEIMRELNIGDGHAGAGAGIMDCNGKEEMLRTKEKLLQDVVRIWSEQPEKKPAEKE